MKFTIPFSATMRESVFAEAFRTGGVDEIDRKVIELLFPSESMSPTPAHLNRISTARMIVMEYRNTFTEELRDMLKKGSAQNDAQQAAIDAMKVFHEKMQATIKDLESEARQAREARGLYVSKELEEAKKAVLAAELKTAQAEERLGIEVGEARRALSENEQLLHAAQMELAGMRSALQLQQTTGGQLMRAMAEENAVRAAALKAIAEAEEKFEERYGTGKDAKVPPFHAFAWKHIAEAKRQLKGDPVKAPVTVNGHAPAPVAMMR